MFKILDMIGCPPRLLKIAQSFHVDMKGVVQFGNFYSAAFAICSGVRQCCVIAPTLFGIFFMVMLKRAFGASTKSDDIYLHTRTHRRLFILSWLKTKSEVNETCCLQVMQHTKEQLKRLMDNFSKASTISRKKTGLMDQALNNLQPSISTTITTWRWFRNSHMSVLPFQTPSP